MGSYSRSGFNEARCRTSSWRRLAAQHPKRPLPRREVRQAGEGAQAMSKACRANPEHLAPVRISKTAWYYEERTGIVVVAEKRNENGSLYAVIHTKIPWWKLKLTMKRQEERE